MWNQHFKTFEWCLLCTTKLLNSTFLKPFCAQSLLITVPCICKRVVSRKWKLVLDVWYPLLPAEGAGGHRTAVKLYRVYREIATVQAAMLWLSDWTNNNWRYCKKKHTGKNNWLIWESNLNVLELWQFCLILSRFKLILKTRSTMEEE